MDEKPSLLQLVQKILREDPRVGIVLAEVLGPPPGLQSALIRPWDEA